MILQQFSKCVVFYLSAWKSTYISSNLHSPTNHVKREKHSSMYPLIRPILDWPHRSVYNCLLSFSECREISIQSCRNGFCLNTDDTGCSGHDTEKQVRTSLRSGRDSARREQENRRRRRPKSWHVPSKSRRQSMKLPHSEEESFTFHVFVQFLYPLLRCLKIPPKKELHNYL